VKLHNFSHERDLNLWISECLMNDDFVNNKKQNYAKALLFFLWIYIYIPTVQTNFKNTVLLKT
jgi:hypothetical protein